MNRRNIDQKLEKIGPARGVFCNRTLNFRGIKAIGYDMDYTLIHYHVAEWEERAYDHLKAHFVAQGWPVAHLKFDHQLVCRGLIIDTEKGNLVKANRFGFIKQAMHGLDLLEHEAMRASYTRVIVELSDPRWVFLNTLFSLSEGCFYAQLVGILDRHELTEVMGYADLYKRVRAALDATHMEGKLKADILADPKRFVELDPEMPLALLDQKQAGKKLMLITNSEWSYAVPMMKYAVDPFLPAGLTWRDLFDVIIIGARKPDFFSTTSPLFEVVTDEGLLSPAAGAFKPGTMYLGGSARQVERHLGLSGDEILYVGDHMFGDVWVSKSVLRWRTALVLREIEDEIRDVQAFRSRELELMGLMAEKEKIEAEQCWTKVELARQKYAASLKTGLEAARGASGDPAPLVAQINHLRQRLDALDQKISPIARASTQLANPIWGVLMRAGNDKSHLAYQVERYADIYTSRVSNLMYETPYSYLRSRRGLLPHEQEMPSSLDASSP